jgi:hypothetical protein
VVRLVGEYLLGYMGAIRRAPITSKDRMRCQKELAVWIASHANPLHKEHPPEHTDPPVQPRRAAAEVARVSGKQRISVKQDTSTLQQEGRSP